MSRSSAAVIDDATPLVISPRPYLLHPPPCQGGGLAAAGGADGPMNPLVADVEVTP